MGDLDQRLPQIKGSTSLVHMHPLPTDCRAYWVVKVMLSTDMSTVDKAIGIGGLHAFQVLGCQSHQQP